MFTLLESFGRTTCFLLTFVLQKRQKHYKKYNTPMNQIILRAASCFTEISLLLFLSTLTTDSYFEVGHPGILSGMDTLSFLSQRHLTFPNRHEYGLQPSRPSADPQLLELVGRDGQDRLLRAGTSRVDLQHTWKKAKHSRLKAVLAGRVLFVQII